MILDVGCNDRPAAGALALDRRRVPGVHLVADGAALPFPPRCLEGVRLYHVLEHVPQPTHLMEEAVRVCRPGGWIEVEVPHALSIAAWVDPTHYRGYTARTFAYWGVPTYGRALRRFYRLAEPPLYVRLPLRLLWVRLLFHPLQRWLGLEWLANHDPEAWEACVPGLAPRRVRARFEVMA